MAKYKYMILSPDGFNIEQGVMHDNLIEVGKALTNFVKRYEQQGFYSTIRNGERLRIPLNEIKSYCKIIKVKNEQTTKR